MDLKTLYQIAEDMAAGETRPAVLFGSRGLTPEQAARLVGSDTFTRIVDAARRFRLGGDQVEYIRERARVAAVTAIDEMEAIIHSPTVDPKARVAAAKLIGDMADVGPKPQAPVTGPPASIVIQFGGQEPLDITGTAIQLPTEGEPGDD